MTIEELTPEEHRLMATIAAADAQDYRSIAAGMELKPVTIQRRVREIARKYGVRGKSQALAVWKADLPRAARFVSQEDLDRAEAIGQNALYLARKADKLNRRTP